MATKRGGQKLKGHALTDSFNVNKLGATATKQEIARAKRAADMARVVVEKEGEAAARKLAEISDQLAKVGKKMGVEVGKELPLPDDFNPEPDKDDGNDDKSAYQMLQNLRYAFRNSKSKDGKKGRARLVALMENDSEFKFFVRELAKIETTMLAAKLRKDGDEGNGNGNKQQFFLVLQGLDGQDGRKSANVAGSLVDMKQISRAITPSDGDRYEPEEENRGAPDEIIRPVEKVEDNTTDTTASTTIDTEGW